RGRPDDRKALEFRAVSGAPSAQVGKIGPEVQGTVRQRRFSTSLATARVTAGGGGASSWGGDVSAHIHLTMKASADGPAGPNPPGREHDKKPSSPRFRLPIGSPLGYLLLVFLGFLLFRNAFQDVGTRRVTYSEFKEAIRKDQFARVQVSNDWVKGFLKDNTLAAPSGQQAA